MTIDAVGVEPFPAEEEEEEEACAALFDDECEPPNRLGLGLDALTLDDGLAFDGSIIFLPFPPLFITFMCLR